MEQESWPSNYIEAVVVFLVLLLSLSSALVYVVGA